MRERLIDSREQRDQLLTWILPWAAPLFATLIIFVLSPLLPNSDFAMIYLAGVLLTAVSTHVKPALICAVLSFLAYNFFETEPKFTFLMIHREDILTGVLLILVATTTGHLAASLREKVRALEASNAWVNCQVALVQKLSACMERNEVLVALAGQIETSLHFSCECFCRDEDSGLLKAIGNFRQGEHAVPEALQFTGSTNLEFHQEDNRALIYFADQGTCIGLICVTAATSFSATASARLKSFAGMALLAWDRVQLGSSLRQETLNKEREQLRSALLSSVSHDLKTPLAIMIGSVSSLIELRSDLDADQQDELMRNTLSEAQRLDRHIQKLLDMARLGHGELTLDRDWVGLEDVVSVVIKRSSTMLRSVGINVDLQPDLPLVYVHPALIEQAIFNILENSIRFAPDHSRIEIAGGRCGGQLWLDICDKGPGIPETAWSNVFDMFYTFSYGDRYPSGTGVGLAISQGILNAHGGSARVLRSEPDAGTTIRIFLPLVQGRPESSQLATGNAL